MVNPPLPTAPMTTTSSRIDWLLGLGEQMHTFLETLKVSGTPGRFKPCPRGTSGAGLDAALGFSCLAHKIHYSLGLWERRLPREQNAWTSFIQSFQNPSGDPLDGSWTDAFIDPGLLSGIAPPPLPGLRTRLHHFLTGRPTPRPREDAIRSETKQAIATLAQIGLRPLRPFPHFPRSRRDLQRHLERLNWAAPWGAGAHAALLAVFVQTQADLLPASPREELAQALRHFFDALVHRESGAYFRAAAPPARGQMINGAMKILNALDWLDQPIHHPERLIDTTLMQGPPPAGCHVVDWIYVLHRCGLATHHRRREIQDRCLEIIDLIQTHHHPDGGFSYQPHIAQTSYYQATISSGLDEGDIHGSCLLIWALTMIAELLEWEIPGWKVLRP
ncbi:MAG: hypothetical protein HQL76_01720 [Magnetococcales bacterium]|nr:hypothetical protein [Magnetococcales bacterium]